MKVKTSDRLKHIMKIRKLKQVDIIELSKPYQKKLGITLQKSTLSQYINDKQSPDQDRIYLLSKTLNVGEAWLMGFDVDSYRVPDEERTYNSLLLEINEISSKLTPPRQQKVLTYANKQLEEQNKVTSLDEYRRKTTVKRVHAAAAGLTGEELFDDLLEEEIEFYEDEVPNGTDFCVLVNGDSMEPAIREGTYAFFREVHEINDGGIALVTLDGAGFIKRVDKYYDHIELISINPKYDSITVSSYNQFKVIGKLVM
ncbi:S24 family peptidase [Mammaliicoccus sciuri]|uniref:S24 family peptidase n=1 Tax=Mammaliicoccus sciuri TaxID=1296 RepID=UPI0037A25F31